MDDIRSVRKRYSAVFFAIGAVMITYEIIGNAVAMLYYLLISPDGEMSVTAMSIESFLIIDVIGTFLLFLLLLPLKKTEPIEKGHMSAKSFIAVLTVLISATMLLAFVGNGVSALLDLFPWISTIDIINDEYADEPLLLSFIISVLLGPIAEELMFRKLILDRIARYGTVQAVLLSGLTFALFHQNFYQFFFAFATGCILALVYCKYGRIRLTIALHSSLNLICGFIPMVINELYELLVREEPLFEGNAASEELARSLLSVGYGTINVFYYLLTFGGAIAGIVLFIIMCRRRKPIGENALSIPAEAGIKAAFVNWGAVFFIILSAFLFALIMVAPV